MAAPPSNRLNLVKLLVGVVAVTALLAYWGGWALPVVILAIIVLVMGHEFGHFITAKRAGMKVTDFFVGFGPVVWATTVGETRYGVRALLLGGYVKVPGMTWTEQIAPEDEARTYRASTYPRKVLFASAGSLMHGIMAVALAWASLSFVGLPSASHVGIAGFTTWDHHARNAAQLAGLHVGDQVLSIDGQPVTDATTLVNAIHSHAGQPVTLVVDRHGRRLTLHATPVDGRHVTVRGTPEATGKSAQGYIGIELEALVTHSSLLGAIPSAFTHVGSVAALAVRSLVHVFSPAEFQSLFRQVTTPALANNPAVQLNRPVSIIGVTRLAVQGAQAGVGTLLEILMTVNIFVGLLNMVPMLPLDGGHVAVATYERLRSRRGRRYHADVNRMTPFAYGFMTILLVLFACTLYLDVAHPIANPFR
ncbi:MAG: M50 family metallopeptidase [Acidimicrobiales bacterium]